MSDYLRDRTYSGQRGVAPALAKMPVRTAGYRRATGGAMASSKRAATGGGQHERMSAVDTAWLRMDGPANTMMIVSVITTATPVPAADLRRVLETRLLCFPRFRKRVETDPLGASWIEDENFDLDDEILAELDHTAEFFTTLEDPEPEEFVAADEEEEDEADEYFDDEEV